MSYRTEAAYRLAAAAVKLATGDPEEACAGPMGGKGGEGEHMRKRLLV